VNRGVRIYIEFSWFLAQKTGRKFVWLDIDGDSKIEDLFLKILPPVIGKEFGETLFKLFLNGGILVIVNGVLVVDPSTKLKDGDRIYIQPLAFGG